MLVASISGDFETAKSAIVKANQVSDLIELRIDLLESDEVSFVSKLKTLSKVPVIFTLRRMDQGGAFEGSEELRKEKLLKLQTLSPSYIDLEYDCNFANELDPSILLICSYHDFEKTPEDLSEILGKMSGFKSSIIKIATKANSILDALRMLKFVQMHKVAGMCMGELGEITRILGTVAGAPLVYSFIGKPTAPGQLSVQDLLEIYHFSSLSPKTKVYGVIGDPIHKSIGYLCHNKIFEAEKFDAVYVRMLVKKPELSSFFKEVKSLPFNGLSVTMPLKEGVAAFADEIDEDVKEVGAYNTLFKREEIWRATNTDGVGAIDAIESHVKVQGKKMLIIGAGGAAKAIAYAGQLRGASIIIANRSENKGRALADAVQGVYTPLTNLPDYDIIVNATSVGMSPDTNNVPIDEMEIKENRVFFDVIMAPKETKFLRLGKERGGEVVYGYELYINQAIRQQRCYLNRSFDEEKARKLIKGFIAL